MALVKSLCFQGPQILTWSTILFLFLQWLDLTIERWDQRSKHVAFDRTHKNTARRCWQELIPRYMAHFLAVELDPPDQYPVITNVWLSLFLASLMWPQQLPWLLEIWTPGWEEAFIHSLTPVNHSGNCLPEELLLQRFFFVSTQLEILSFWEILGQKNITSIWKINLKFQCLVSVVLVVCGKKKGKGSVGGSGNLEKIVINIKLLKMLLLPFNH